MTSTEVRRHPERQSRDRAELDAILDAGMLAHLGAERDGVPVVLPLLYARDGDRLLLHGSTGAGLLGAAATGAQVCVCVTLFDALVFADSLFESSANYRCAVVMGRARALTGPAKAAALDVLSDHVMPGRRGEVGPHTAKQLAATQVLALPLTTWSVKARSGPPGSVAAGVWTGVLPLALQVSGEPEHVSAGPVASSVRAWQPPGSR